MNIITRITSWLVEAHPTSPDPQLSYLRIGRRRPPSKGSFDEWLFDRAARRLNPFYYQEGEE